MKYLTIFFLSFTFALDGFSQCQPDTNCIDIDEPGQVCPDSLPAGQVDVPYDQVVTIIAPDSAALGNQMIGLYKIEVDTVTNLPPGLTYYIEDPVFFPDSLYCIDVSGTPTDSGIFYLKISVYPYIYSSTTGEIKLPLQIDSTSVYITIEAASSSIVPEEDAFKLLPAAPNPFSTETRIGATTREAGDMRLRIYDLTGKAVYEEHKQAARGKNFFSFNGKKLSSGMYFIYVSFNNHILTGKLVKTQ